MKQDAHQRWSSPTPDKWRELRQRHGLTQTRVGELVCTPLRTVQAWEAGHRRIPPMAWDLLRLRLGVDIPDSEV